MVPSLNTLGSRIFVLRIASTTAARGSIPIHEVGLISRPLLWIHRCSIVGALQYVAEGLAVPASSTGPGHSAFSGAANDVVCPPAGVDLVNEAPS